MSTAVLSLGSNLGERRALLRTALHGLGPGLTGLSPVYETDPWGPVPQGDFLNVIALVTVPGRTVEQWLALAQELENAAGRTREVRWGPRTLDVDVIAVRDDDGRPVFSDDPRLTLPHPQAANRAFVLVPWLAVDPHAELPGSGTVEALLRALPEAERLGVRLRADLDLRADVGPRPAPEPDLP